MGRSAGTVLRAQEGSGEDEAFALCARGFGDRLQCSLRTDPAPLGILVIALMLALARSRYRFEGWVGIGGVTVEVGLRAFG
jgi:hypothetical protein